MARASAMPPRGMEAALAIAQSLDQGAERRSRHHDGSHLALYAAAVSGGDRLVDAEDKKQPVLEILERTTRCEGVGDAVGERRRPFARGHDADANQSARRPASRNGGGH